MRWKAIRWYDPVTILLPLGFPIWALAVGWAADRARLGQHQPTEFQEATVDAILALRFYVPMGLALLFIGLHIFRLTRESVPKKTVRNFLNLLHEKYFSHPTIGLDKRYRVSLFTPVRWAVKWKVIPYPTRHKHLVLFSRSGDIYPKSKLRWDITSSEEGQFDGVAGYAWVTGNFVDIQDLANYSDATEEEKLAYRKSTYIDAEKVNKLHVRAQSYQALVVQNKVGEKVSLLVMECEEPQGLAMLKKEEWGDVAKTLQCLFLS
jgi:hypothetical protein